MTERIISPNWYGPIPFFKIVDYGVMILGMSEEEIRYFVRDIRDMETAHSREMKRLNPDKV